MKSKTEAEINFEACEWLARLRNNTASEEDKSYFRAWRSADPRHAKAYNEALIAINAVRENEDLQEMAALVYEKHERSRRSSFNRQLGAFFSFPFPITFSSAVAAAILFLITGGILLQPANQFVDYKTQTAEINEIKLPDGSVIFLGPASSVRISYSDTERRVYLDEGEAFFDVVTDSDRVFIVDTANANINVLGTQFNVNRTADGVRVAVAEGKVEVVHVPAFWRDPLSPVFMHSRNRETRLEAGEQVRALRNSGIRETVELSPESAGAWRTGFLKYPDNPLHEFVSDINRYSEIPIALSSDELKTLTLFAAFQTRDIDQILNNLEELLPIWIDRSDPRQILIRPIADS